MIKVWFVNIMKKNHSCIYFYIMNFLSEVYILSKYRGLFYIHNRRKNIENSRQYWPLNIYVHMYTLKNSWQNDYNRGWFSSPATF